MLRGIHTEKVDTGRNLLPPLIAKVPFPATITVALYR
jgi:hypothetical protein